MPDSALRSRLCRHFIPLKERVRNLEGMKYRRNKVSKSSWSPEITADGSSGLDSKPTLFAFGRSDGYRHPTLSSGLSAAQAEDTIRSEKKWFASPYSKLFNDRTKVEELRNPENPRSLDTVRLILLLQPLRTPSTRDYVH